MPRPKRTRRAPPGEAKAPGLPSDTEHLSDDASRPRGRKRTRTTRPAASRLSLGEHNAIRAANSTRDAALDKLANEDATTASGQVSDDDTRSSIQTGRRAVATPTMRRDTTGLDLADDDVFGDLDDSFANGELPRGRLSVDGSSLTMSHFKPRSRQSSVVGRNEAPIRPSSRGPTTPGLASSFNIGVFRRRAREPSILATSRKPRPELEVTADDSVVGSEASFEPEAESTPLNDRRPTRTSIQLDREISPAQSSSRKRKSVEASVDGDGPDSTSRPEPGDAEHATLDSDSELTSLASPSPPPLGLPHRPVTPVNQDEITAPPVSSDSEADVDVWPDIHVLARRRRRPSAMSAMHVETLSNVSSPPSLTHSPNYAAEKAVRRRQQSPKITTADLTSLLPKRRHKRTLDSLGLESDEELDTTHLAQDEDELSYLDARAARRRKDGRPPSRATSARPASRTRPNSSVLKQKQTPAAPRQSTRGNKTYRRRSSDKENESDDDEEGESAFMPLPDNTFDEAGTGDSETPSNASADELKSAAKKFIEVDKWELEFEEVVGPSSPQDAR